MDSMWIWRKPDTLKELTCRGSEPQTLNMLIVNYDDSDGPVSRSDDAGGCCLGPKRGDRWDSIQPLGGRFSLLPHGSCADAAL